jgi:hypothetical protein
MKENIRGGGEPFTSSRNLLSKEVGAGVVTSFKDLKLAICTMIMHTGSCL